MKFLYNIFLIITVPVIYAIAISIMMFAAIGMCIIALPFELWGKMRERKSKPDWDVGNCVAACKIHDVEEGER